MAMFLGLHVPFKRGRLAAVQFGSYSCWQRSRLLGGSSIPREGKKPTAARAGPSRRRAAQGRIVPALRTVLSTGG